MSDAELSNPGSLKGPDRERIAAISGQSVDDVVRMLSYFQQTKIIATWLYMRLARKRSLRVPWLIHLTLLMGVVRHTNKEKIPENENEMMVMQEEDSRLREIATNMYVVMYQKVFSPVHVYLCAKQHAKEETANRPRKAKPILMKLDALVRVDLNTSSLQSFGSTYCNFSVISTKFILSPPTMFVNQFVLCTSHSSQYTYTHNWCIWINDEIDTD
jgi:hypothetical protein